MEQYGLSAQLASEGSKVNILVISMKLNAVFDIYARVTLNIPPSEDYLNMSNVKTIKYQSVCSKLFLM